MTYKFDSLKNNILKIIIFLFPMFLVLGNAISNLFFSIVSIIYFVDCVFKRELLYKNKTLFKCFLLLYLYLIFNSLISYNPEISLIRSIGYLKFFIFVLVYLNFFENHFNNFKILAIFWLLIIISLNLDIIYQVIYGYDIFGYKSENYLRNSGFFFDELVAGSFLLAFAFLSIFLFQNSKNDQKYVLLFLIFCFIICIFTGERSNTIKFLIIFLLTFIFCINKQNIKFKKNILIYFVSIIIISSLIYLNFDNLKTRYTHKISFSENQNINYAEKYITSAYGSHFLAAYLIFKDNYFLGAGNKNFRFECEKYEDKISEIHQSFDTSKDFFHKGCSTHPHQIYYELLSEHGLIGFCFFIYFLFLPIYKKLRSSKLNQYNLVSLFYILCIFIPILPSGSFFSTFSSSLFWINYLFILTSKK